MILENQLQFHVFCTITLSTFFPPSSLFPLTSSASDLHQLKAHTACLLTNTLQEVMRCLPAGDDDAAAAATNHHMSSHFKPRSLLSHRLPLTSLR